MKTSTPSTGQETKYRRLVADSSRRAADLALKKTGTDQDGWQRVLEHGDKLCDAIVEVVVAKTRELSLSNQFADEEVKSSYTYPSEYKGPKPIEDQIRLLAEILDLDPTLALEYAKSLPEIPEGAEGWFAIASVDALAKKHFPEVTDPTEKYCRAVQFLHDKIVASRRFYNYRRGQITPAQLRVHARTAAALAKLAETQKSDILIVAAQFGMRHRGRSVRRARVVMNANEFGLGAFEVGSLLLTHPERLISYDDLWVDCAGDEFAPDADGVFCRAPCFDFRGAEVRFDSYGVSHARGYYGSASAFLPQ